MKFTFYIKGEINLYTYLLSYSILYFDKEVNKRRILNFNREIESLEDVKFIEENLQIKLGGVDIAINSFSPLKKNEDDIVYSLDEDWE